MEIDLNGFEDWLYGKMARSTVEETMRKIRFLARKADISSRERILEMLRSQRKAGAEAKRINEYVKVLNRWLEFRKEDKIEYLKVRRSFTVKYYDEDSIRTILSRIGSSTPEDFRNRTMVLLALNTGLRRSEIADLLVEDVHENFVLVRRGKGEKARTVYIDPETKRAIAEYLTRRNNPSSPFLFTTKGSKVTPEYMGKIAEQITEKTGIRFSWHKCRHTYAKMLLRSGVDLETIRIMLGHENLGTTQIYATIGADEALERLSKSNVRF
ncbi:site-specific integrase [Thermoplasmatales archaeon AK]|nr:site-specific integrase [Thermoplasmatales archaeon AK]